MKKKDFDEMRANVKAKAKANRKAMQAAKKALTKKAKKSGPKTDEPERGPCYKCKKDVDKDQYCFGCKKFICESCSLNWDMPFGGHSVDLHFEEPRY